MSEPLRTPADPAPASEAERDALIERLLLAGLDQYFDGDYQEAVNVWTRVAFLERGHGRARAYIERARGALAERQREAEETLHRGIAAYDSGDVETARALLTRAIAEGGANETAQVFLQRLGRIDPSDLPASSSVHDVSPALRAPRVELPFVRRHARADAAADPARVSWVATTVVCVAIAAAILFAAQPIASWLGERPLATPAAESRPAEALPIVRVSELRLARAAELHRSGRLRDALRLLDEVGMADPLRPQADSLTAAVQRDLLSLAAGPAPRSVPEAPR